jgi:hypothetical protein
MTSVSTNHITYNIHIHDLTWYLLARTAAAGRQNEEPTTCSRAEAGLGETDEPIDHKLHAIAHRITGFFWTFPSSGILETTKHDVSVLK